MTSTSTLRLLLIAGLGPLLAAPSLAQGDSYAYGGLGLGQSRAKIDQERISATLLGNGLSTTGFSRDESDRSYRLFGGYQFNRYFGLEGGYFNLGKFSFAANTAPAGTLTGQIKLQGFNLDVVGALPLGERWSLIGRVGAQAAQAKDNFAGSGNVVVLNPNPSKREVNVKYGAGIQYEVNRSFLVRGEAERYRVNDAVGNHGGVNVYSVSLVFPFGRAPQALPRVAAVAPAPTLVYVAPLPPPVVVVQAPAPVVQPVPAAPLPVAPARRRVSFLAESLFGFDKSTIRPEGRSALDTFAAEIRGASFDIITVEGHTDRLGTPAYNQKLSIERADAVKAYLVSTGGIEASKVSIVAKGESEPVTQGIDCQGKAATAKLIACLQPDRRVEIEVTGTR